MKRTPLDDHCQIRIRAAREDGQESFAVHLGFWMPRGRRRVWVDEANGHIGTYETRDGALKAATEPALIARRDAIREMRGNPPAPAPYLILPNVCYKIVRGWTHAREYFHWDPALCLGTWKKSAAKATRYACRQEAETMAGGAAGDVVAVLS
jgi:hypothetical protein